MEIRTRISDFITGQKLSVRAFGMVCGIHQATLDKQLKGLRDVSLETVIKICTAFPNLSTEWLMRGEGPMYKSEITNQNDERINKLIATIGEMQSIVSEKQKVIDDLMAENEKLKK